MGLLSVCTLGVIWKGDYRGFKPNNFLGSIDGIKPGVLIEMESSVLWMESAANILDMRSMLNTNQKTCRLNHFCLNVDLNASKKYTVLWGGKKTLSFHTLLCVDFLWMLQTLACPRGCPSSLLLAFVGSMASAI